MDRLSAIDHHVSKEGSFLDEAQSAQRYLMAGGIDSLVNQDTLSNNNCS
jgi:hypothetical protein